ncbi:MAG: OmpH family outer membrane protein [Firmicutes bacterium]|nr:OmpH family outer membrane protein [Bacillota bacterium]
MNLRGSFILAAFLLGALLGLWQGAKVQVGVVDLDRIMTESPRALAADRELAAKYEEISQRIEEELAVLSGDERAARESEAFGEYLQLKMDLEGLLTQAIDQAIDEVKRKRGIQVVVHRDAVKLGGVDITDDVIRFLE